jgi:hypothetical protein
MAKDKETEVRKMIGLIILLFVLIVIGGIFWAAIEQAGDITKLLFFGSIAFLILVLLISWIYSWFV